MGPWSILSLLATLILLFAFQGTVILEQPLIIALLSIPIVLQVVFNAGFAYWLNRKFGESHAVACPSAFIGASNFFEFSAASGRWWRIQGFSTRILLIQPSRPHPPTGLPEILILATIFTKFGTRLPGNGHLSELAGLIIPTVLVPTPF